MSIGKERITTTESHPFYVKNRGFVPAGKDKLVTMNGRESLVEEILQSIVG